MTFRLMTAAGGLGTVQVDKMLLLQKACSDPPKQCKGIPMIRAGGLVTVQKDRMLSLL